MIGSESPTTRQDNNQYMRIRNYTKTTVTKFIFFFLLLMCLAGCDNSEKNDRAKTPDREELTGEWNNLSMRITINSKNNSDSNEVFEVDRPEWEQTLKIKPIRTFFRADSSWNSAHYNLKDSLVYNPSGKWWFENDKLIMMQNFPSPDTTGYDLNIKSDTATFEGNVDWDRDGKKDDVYFGRQRRVNR